MISNTTRETLRKASAVGAMGKLLKSRHLIGAAVGAGLGAATGGKNGRLRGALIGAGTGATAGHFLGKSRGLIKAGRQASNAFKAIPKGSPNKWGAYKDIGKTFGSAAWNTLKGNTAMQAGTLAAGVGAGSLYGNRKYQQIMNNPVVQIGRGIHNFMNR